MREKSDFVIFKVAEAYQLSTTRNDTKTGVNQIKAGNSESIRYNMTCTGKITSWFHQILFID